MQMLRAVEYGFSFIRPCANGLSIAIDYNGTIVSSMSSFTTTDEIMYADVPVKGIWTLYTFIGDLLAWLCIPFFVLFIFMAVSKARKER
jgi:apolipoprotein N-acyltransferase